MWDIFYTQKSSGTEDKLHIDKAAPHLSERIRRLYNKRNNKGNTTTEHKIFPMKDFQEGLKEKDAFQ